MVESINGHRGNRQRRSTMEFKVRWVGFRESCDCWEPYEALLHLDKVHDYLRANTMKPLTPKERPEICPIIAVGVYKICLGSVRLQG